MYQGLVNMFYESEHNKYSRLCVQKAKLTQCKHVHDQNEKAHDLFY